MNEVNFKDDKNVLVGSKVNFTVQVSSNLSLTSVPKWSRLNAELSKHSYITNYAEDRNNYTSLIINEASYYTDSGLYYLNTSNYCGPTSVSVVLYIQKDKMTSNRICDYCVIHTHTHTRTCTHTHTHTQHTHTYTHTHIHTHTHTTHTYTHTTQTHTHIHTHTHTHTHTYTHIYTHIHIHTHTCLLTLTCICSIQLCSH